MTLTVQTRSLVEALATANKCAPTAARQESGDLVWLRVSNGDARLTWSPNGKTPGGSVRVADAHGEADFPLLSTRRLRSSIAKEFRGVDVAEIADGGLSGGGAQVRLEMGSVPGRRVPPVPPQEPDGIAVTLDGDTFDEASYIAGFAATDEYRPLLMQVEIFQERGVVRLAATDSYRLGTHRIERISPPDAFRAWMPASLIKAAAKLDGDEVKVEIDGERAVITRGAVRLWADHLHRTDSNFPYVNWRGLMKDRPTQVGAVLKDPQAAAERIRAYVRANPALSKYGVLELRFEGGSVDGRFHERNVESLDWETFGEAEVAVPARVGVNHTYLLGSLAAAKKRTRVFYETREDGWILRPLCLESGNSLRHLVMPVRV